MIDEEQADDALDAGNDDPDADAFLREVARVDDLPPPDGELRAGDRLAHFVIGARLGAGSMGAVYEARDQKLGRTVAIKVMRRTTAEARARFVQEARAAAAVTHPNLVTVHEIGEYDGRVFIVMERIPGRTLRGLRATQSEGLRIAREIAAGLAAVHAAGIVHRDLKPDNVMLGADDTVKLVDFGIALISGAKGTGGDVAGTPRYMSPEQAAGQHVDSRSDIYAFGALVKELCGDSPALDAIIPRCLETDPSARYADGKALVDALAAASVRPAGPAGWPRWLKVPLQVVAVLALAAGGVAYGLWRVGPAKPRPMRIEAAPDVRAANPAALDAYRGAFQALHDAQFFESVRGFENAVKLDPTFAAAHLRLGLAKRWFHSQEEGRRSFQIAVLRRLQLDARDRALLDAAEPAVMRDPYDYAESQRRFLAALKRYPDDSELMYWLGWTYGELGQHDKLLPLTQKLAELDPTSAVAQSGRALTLFYMGDLYHARLAAHDCRDAAPTQGTCAFELKKILDDMGRCDELEEVLRAWTVASPDEPRAKQDLAALLAATGQPRAAVEELIGKDNAAELLSWYTGNFARQPAEEPSVVEQIDIAFETGQPEKARAAAEAYLAKSPAFRAKHGTSDADLFSDPLGVVLETLARTGAITRDEYKKRRDDWVRDLDTSIAGVYHEQIWAHAFANSVATPEDAAEALAALPAKPLPKTYWFQHTYGHIGRTFLLGGRPADAVPYLERATRRCMYRDPRDFFYLGKANEALDKLALACVAYAEVVTRWGGAEPRSVTADAARERMKAIGCPQSLGQ